MKLLTLLWISFYYFASSLSEAISSSDNNNDKTRSAAAPNNTNTLDNDFFFPNLLEYKPSNPTWKAYIDRKLTQVLQAWSKHEGMEDEYLYEDAYGQLIYSGMKSPAFTENGWGLTRVPDDVWMPLQSFLTQQLQQMEQSGAPLPLEEEDADDEDEDEGPLPIEGDSRPWFVENVSLNRKIHRKLIPLFNAWAGVDVKPTSVYGLRIYRNQSRLMMHIDEVETHVISGILHVGHDEESEPWPLVIEDFNGVTNEVVLEPGHLLFYESSKCLHGRPRRFQGSWYTSLFLHYAPVNDWHGNDYLEEAYEDIPPQGYSNIQQAAAAASKSSIDQMTQQQLPELQMINTSFEEPECRPHSWCNLERSKLIMKLQETMSTTTAAASTFERGEEEEEERGGEL